MARQSQNKKINNTISAPNLPAVFVVKKNFMVPNLAQQGSLPDIIQKIEACEQHIAQNVRAQYQKMLSEYFMEEKLEVAQISAKIDKIRERLLSVQSSDTPDTKEQFFLVKRELYGIFQECKKITATVESTVMQYMPIMQDTHSAIAEVNALNTEVEQYGAANHSDNTTIDRLTQSLQDLHQELQGYNNSMNDILHDNETIPNRSIIMQQIQQLQREIYDLMQKVDHLNYITHNQHTSNPIGLEEDKLFRPQDDMGDMWTKNHIINHD